MEYHFCLLISVLYFCTASVFVEAKRVKASSCITDHRRHKHEGPLKFHDGIYIHFDMKKFQHDCPPLVEKTNDESFTIHLKTTEDHGLVWLDKRRDLLLYLSIMNGSPLFVINKRQSRPKLMTFSGNPRIDDGRWHTFKINRNGKTLQFFLNDNQTTTTTLKKELQLVGNGDIYLGGSPNTTMYTNGRVRERFTGFVKKVVFMKRPLAYRIIEISLLQFSYDVSSPQPPATPRPPQRPTPRPPQRRPPRPVQRPTPPSTKRPTPRPTQRRPPRPIQRPTPSPTQRLRPPPVITNPPVLPPEKIIDPLTFTGGHIRVPGSIDISRGSISFGFKTLDSRGPLFFTHSSRNKEDNFVSVEIFDGKLFFVFKLGKHVNRRQISNIPVNDDQWHNVNMKFHLPVIDVTLDKLPPVRLQENDQNVAIMDGGIYIGGGGDEAVLPWNTFSLHDTFFGCFQNLRLQDMRTNIQRKYRLPPGIIGVQNGCIDSTNFCTSRPCVHGRCHNEMRTFRCDCTDTGFMGIRCETPAIVGGFEGDESVVYDYDTTSKTHTNDISIRFRTPLKDTFLFQTASDNYNEFIRGELENGRLKTTIRTGRNRNDVQTFYTGAHIDDYDWHVYNLRRRAEYLEHWVDDLPYTRENINNEDFFVNIDRIHLGSDNSTVTDTAPDYIGFLQNVYFNDQDVLEELKSYPASMAKIIWIQNEDDLTYKPVTFKTPEAYSSLPSLSMEPVMLVTFKFKTPTSDGLILYNKGVGKNLLAVELHNGYVTFKYGKGYSMKIDKKIDDDLWHMFEVRRNGGRHYDFRVDEVKGKARLLEEHDLVDDLYIGGMPEKELKSDKLVRNNIRSAKGFVGCIGSVYLNGDVPELKKSAKTPEMVANLCVPVSGVCPTVNPCKNNGICRPGVHSYTCDCSGTGYAGPKCQEYIGGVCPKVNPCKNNGICRPGVHSYTCDCNGTMYAGSKCQHYIGGVCPTVNPCKNNGICRSGAYSYTCDCNMTGYAGPKCQQYPLGTYCGKTGVPAVLKYSLETPYTSTEENIVLGFMTYSKDGILATFERENKAEYINIRLGNGYLVAEYDTGGGKETIALDAVKYNDGRYHVVAFSRNSERSKIMVDGVEKSASHKYAATIFNELQNIYICGKLGPNNAVLNRYTGIVGGMYWNGHRFLDLAYVSDPKVLQIGGPIAIDKTGYVLDPLVEPPPLPPKTGTPVTYSGGGGPISGIGSFPRIGALREDVVFVTGTAKYPRAGTIIGGVLGSLAFLASLVWAFAECKPGMCGGEKEESSAMVISAPTAATNLLVAQALGAGSDGTALSANAKGTGPGGGTKITLRNSSASAEPAGSATLADSNTLRATGMFTNKDTTIGLGASPGSPTSADFVGGSAVLSEPYTYSTAMNVHSAPQQDVEVGYGESTTADYDMADGIIENNIQTSTLRVRNGYAGGGGGTLSRGYSTSTVGTLFNYQVQNVRTMVSSPDGHHMMTIGRASSGSNSDEVRVDCCLMTGDGRRVITGSSQGPPQVWDMATGELISIMKGDTYGSTNLHLACNEKLLVGAVHADAEINEYSSRKNVTNKKLQIWDFVTGKPLQMDFQETCSALCVLSDPDKVVFARSEKYGNATDFVIWDLLGNQSIKDMRYDAPVGNKDYINYLALSQNDRYCVAGYTNTVDNYSEFFTFDITLTTYNIGNPTFLKLDANLDCTIILPGDEAVSGLRNGDLVIWSLKTGQYNRQFISDTGASAHSQEINALKLSKDSKLLLSASTDGILKIWDAAAKRQIKTLVGHNDEIWCFDISQDNEVVVSGSRDGSIRLWKTKTGNELCAFTTGVDVFYVTMSHNKGTIVALGDKNGSRKLIMLQVLRSKIRRLISA